MTLTELFLELASPDENGVSRWVSVDEFVGRYAGLKIGNGLSWGRKESKLAREYKIETEKSWGKIVRIRLNGFNENDFSQHISGHIKKIIRAQRCVILGTSNPEVDHKNGMKNEARVMRQEAQFISDFQPLSKAANDAKRQHCKECIRNGERFDAKRLGYPISFYKGGAYHHNEEDACIGCFWYDPIEFRKHLERKTR